MLANVAVECPWCDSKNAVKFPCCGYLCMTCGKSYEEEDIKNKQRSQSGGNECC
jgi:transposase-like protein